MALTYNRLYMDIRQTLLDTGALQASLEARELVCAVSNKTKEQLVNDYQIYVPPEVEAAAGELLSRRLSGEPLAYLIGKWDFMGMELEVSRGVLIPRADTETLAQKAIDFMRGRDREARMLDLCTGSGCVGLAVINNTEECRAVLADISNEAVRTARANARKYDKSGRASCVIADALKPAPLTMGAFDLIVCNPPYIPAGEIPKLDRSVSGYEPLLALDGGQDGMRFYKAVASGWRHAVKAGGRLMFECGANQARDVCSILERCSYGSIEIARDLRDIERVVSAAPE